MIQFDDTSSEIQIIYFAGYRKSFIFFFVPLQFTGHFFFNSILLTNFPSDFAKNIFKHLYNIAMRNIE